MTILRVTSEIWVSAFRTKLEKEGVPFYFYKKGDKSAGAILIKVFNFKRDFELYHRIIGLNGKQKWEILLSGNEQKIDEAIKRQYDFDPDIWVIEIEDPKGKIYLDNFDKF